jgi:ABC-type glycerol-3-phosphate transport system substrate-binding protein
MYPMLSGAISGLVAASDLETVNKKIGFFGISAETPVMSWEGSEALLVPQTGDAEKQAVALAFIDWLTGPYYATYLADTNQYPVITGFDDKIPVVPDALTQARSYFDKDGVAEYEQTLLAAVGDIDGAILEMLAGKKTPLEVAETIQRNFEENAKNVGLPGF